jgi:hypothetical protein
MLRAGSSLSLVLLACVSVVTLSPNGQAAPILWSPSLGGNGHYYDLVLPADPSGNLTWFQARDAAAATSFLGSAGHLVTITTAAEDAFLRAAFESQLRVDFLPGDSGDFAWLGLTDAAREGDYRWITGEPFTFSNWAPPEPNNLGDEDYIHLWRRDYGDGAGPRWSWNDTDPGPVVARWDTARFGYLVEFDGPFVASVPAPPTATLVVSGALGVIVCRWRRGKRCQANRSAACPRTCREAGHAS